MQRHLTYTVTPAEEGWPLERILLQKLLLSPGQVRTVKFAPGGIEIDRPGGHDDRPMTTRTPVTAGDVVRIAFPDEGPSVIPNAGPVSILYSSDDLFFVDKEAGLAVHPAHGHYTDTLVNRLAALNPEPVRLIGRLDKDTSGVIAVARNALAASRLEAQRRDGTLRRIYLALVAGRLTGSGLIDTPLLETRDNTPLGSNGHPLRLMKADPAGIPAGTEFQVLETFPGFTLVQLHLLTGRTHQIRAHMASIGHPLLGDALYQEFAGHAPGEITPAPRTMLHSRRIECLHPFTGEDLLVEAPLPADLLELLPETSEYR